MFQIGIIFFDIGDTLAVVNPDVTDRLDLLPLPGAVEALRRLSEAGLRLGVISNTRYNGRGYDVRLELHGSLDAIAAGLDESLPLRSADPAVTFPSRWPPRAAGYWASSATRPGWSPFPTAPRTPLPYSPVVQPRRPPDPALIDAGIGRIARALIDRLRES